jgi:hypothetical protein
MEVQLRIMSYKPISLARYNNYSLQRETERGVGQIRQHALHHSETGYNEILTSGVVLCRLCDFSDITLDFRTNRQNFLRLRMC